MIDHKLRLAELEPGRWYRITYRAGSRILTRTCFARDKNKLEQGWMEERVAHVGPLGPVFKYRGIHVGEVVLDATPFDTGEI
jgi:hypothetical protein